MAKRPPQSTAGRNDELREMLVRLRDTTYERVKRYRRDQEDENVHDPADDLDVARATSDVETHASLIALDEEKLRFIDEALARLEVGKYGVCLGCGEPIPVARLRAIPFAIYCVDCQEQRTSDPTWNQGGTIQPYDRQWTVPKEMEESTDSENEDYSTTGPEEEVPIHDESAFGPEEPNSVGRTKMRKTIRPRKL